MDLKLSVRGDLKAAMARDRRVIEAATTESVQEATNALKRQARAEVAGALDSRKAPKLIRSKVFVDGPADSAGIVFSKWRKRDGGDPLLPHVRGATLRPDRSKFLVIPAKGTSRRVNATRRSLDRLGEDPKLALIPTGRGSFWFVRKTSKRRTVLLAKLVRRVEIPKRIDFNRPILRAERGLPDTLHDKLGKLERG